MSSTELPINIAPMPTPDFASHMHLVLSIVAEFMRRVPRSVQREDLVSAGSLGLFQALRSTSHISPEMFTAYARMRIRGSIVDELRRHDWAPRRRRTPDAKTPPPAQVIMPPAEAPAGARPASPAVVVIRFDDLPPTDTLCAVGMSPLEVLERKRSTSEVRRAVDKLPPRERAIVTMRYFEDMPSKSIASSLGVSEARVSQLLTRARLQLKELMNDSVEEEDLAA